MFRYVDHFFPEEEEEKCCGGYGGGDRSSYNKLSLHFTIDDLSHAERSVDERMARENDGGEGGRAIGGRRRGDIQQRRGSVWFGGFGGGATMNVDGFEVHVGDEGGGCGG